MSDLEISNHSFIYSRGIKYPTCPAIYQIKNLVNNKVYVGSAKNLDTRIKKHIWGLANNKHRNIILSQAVKKYGVENFYFILLEFCDYKDIVEREQFWINHFQSYKKENGYNIQPTAYSNKGNKLSPETKEKISKFFKGKPKTAEQNRKNSIAHLGVLNANYGKPISEKLRQAIKESNKRRNDERLKQKGIGDSNNSNRTN